MTTLKQNTSLENTTEFSVDFLYARALAHLEHTHKALDKLPKDPNGDKTPSLVALKQALSIPTSDAEILTSMMAHGVVASVGAAFGVVAGVAAQTVDIAMNYNESRANSVQGKTSVPTAPKHEPGNRPTIKRTAAPQFATNIMRKSVAQSQMRAYNQSLKKREALERQLQDIGDKIMELNAHKASKTDAVVMTPDGKEIKGLAKRRFVFKVDQDRFERRESFAQKYGKDPRTARQYAAPKPPAPGMAAFG